MCIYVRVLLHVYLCVHLSMCVWAWVRLREFLSPCACLCVNMGVCSCVRMCVPCVRVYKLISLSVCKSFLKPGLQLFDASFCFLFFLYHVASPKPAANEPRSPALVARSANTGPVEISAQHVYSVKTVSLTYDRSKSTHNKIYVIFLLFCLNTFVEVGS